MAQTVLVTGANGFVGRALCAELTLRGYVVRAAVRKLCLGTGLPDEITAVGDIGANTDWRLALADVDAVIHLAARVHVLRENAREPLAAFRAVNVEATERLVHQAVGLDVKRFVYLSSIGVHGNCTTDCSFNEKSAFIPDNPYSVSKCEAERKLFEISARSTMDVVVVRPPLVYGPNNPGNFLRLLRLIERGIPLPLASVNNRRSMIFVGNLVDALIACATHVAAARNAYIVSDGEDVSTPQLIAKLARLMGRSARLWPFPSALLYSTGRLIGKADEVQRLIGSLQVDSSRIRNELDWTPPFAIDQGLAETVRWFVNQSRHSTNAA